MSKNNPQWANAKEVWENTPDPVAEDPPARFTATGSLEYPDSTVVFTHPLKGSIPLEAPDLEVSRIVYRLTHPHKSQYTGADRQTVSLDKTWAVGIAGTARFRGSPGPRKLAHYDLLATLGPVAGLPQEILDWLLSKDETREFPASIFSKEE
ncbi:hypothetical protein BKA66DRAFT_572790 [Pyrenochaeta sp. MPI-SDFR-AT-0127]|nr:hypothetical protein BKA66DRAFT_572790 [Pyrenochaeta sp. MPI-SDFR-AT-0127]